MAGEEADVQESWPVAMAMLQSDIHAEQRYRFGEDCSIEEI